jgi:hypothetical protein
MNLLGLIRELRLMKDQPSHRFYAVAGLVLFVFIGGVLLRSAFVAGLLMNFGKCLQGGCLG